jgi:hypothetical protein
MDGVLGNIDTDHIPEPQPKPETVLGVSVKDLRPGQTIRFEFGVPDNWVTMHIERIEPFDKMLTLFGKNNGYQDDYSFRPEDVVEVIKNG